jgi:hypothetical protein
MRVSTLIVLVFVGFLIALGIVYRGWVFGRVDRFNQWNAGFAPAQTPNEAMEKFREAIQQRRYSWAASYCMPEYAECLIKCEGPAAQLGAVIDSIRTYMDNKQLGTDQSKALLLALDPFPGAFKINGAVKTINDKDAVGQFVWDPLPYNSSYSLDTLRGQVDEKMFRTNLVATGLFSPGGVHVVKDGDAWKLHVVPTPANLDDQRYFLDHWQANESELRAFRTYMTNGRYDSAKSFESEMLDSLRKARP